jgi:hypothetical protein
MVNYVCNPEIDTFFEKAITYTGDDCLIWPFAVNSWRYASLSSGRFRKKYKTNLIARAVCIEVYGPPPTSKHDAAHSPDCISKACINRKHLRWATHKDNMADDRHGEDNSYARLTNEQVLEIRKLKGIMTHKEIGEQFGIPRINVTMILNYSNWAWLEEPTDAELIFATTKPRMKDLFA